MSEKSNPVSQKARDEAIRALASRGGLTPDQISELKLSQVHLTTGTLVVQPKESAPADQPATLKLDSAMHRAVIAWLVVRPDSSNDHLFPGAGLAGLDTTIIREVVAAAAAAKPPTPAPPPPGAQVGKPVGAAKPPTPAPPATLGMVDMAGLCRYFFCMSGEHWRSGRIPFGPGRIYPPASHSGCAFD